MCSKNEEPKSLIEDSTSLKKILHVELLNKLSNSPTKIISNNFIKENEQPSYSCESILITTYNSSNDDSNKTLSFRPPTEELTIKQDDIQDNVLDNSDEIDDVINYQEDFEEDFTPKKSHVFKSLANNECLPLVESFQLSDQNEVSECPLKNFDHEYDEQKLKQNFSHSVIEYFAKNNPEKRQVDDENEEEETKSISSIEGSLKGNSNYEELAGLSSSTPLIHLYPKLGK